MSALLGRDLIGAGCLAHERTPRSATGSGYTLVGAGFKTRPAWPTARPDIGHRPRPAVPRCAVPTPGGFETRPYNRLDPRLFPDPVAIPGAV